MTCTQNKQTQGLCPQYGFNAGTNQINNSGFSYDASGDMLSDNSHTYQYDAEGRLISVDNGSTASYVYNAEGERVEKDAGGNYTEYVFGLTKKPEGEYNRTAWTDTWVSFQGRHFAHFSNGDTYFVHADRIGTTNIVTDWNTGTVVQDELHYPWGQVWTSAGSSIEERFASLQHRDSESNLDPTKYRMFSSDAGRWTTPDPADQMSVNPLNPQSWNRYAYALNNSTTFADPYGLCSRWQIVRGVAECVGGVAMTAGCLAGDVSTGGLLTVLAVACASEGAGLAVQGTLNIFGGATSTNVSPAVNAVGSMGNLVGLTATVGSGFNLNVGKGASIAGSHGQRFSDRGRFRDHAR